MSFHQDGWLEGITLNEQWCKLLEQRRQSFDLKATEIPATGPEPLNVTSEITHTLVRLAVLLEWQKARVQQMELGIDYTMVNRWVNGTAAEIEGLGLTHLGIARVLTKRGY